jgi:2-iminobutanoate/2-iminopropanoate deaminase
MKPNRILIVVSGLSVLSVLGCAIDHAPAEDAPHSHVAAAAREIVATDDAPAAIGPYSQAIRVGDTLYCAGQIAIDPASGEMVAGGIEPETRQVLANIQAVLRSVGFSPQDVVQAQVFLADLNDYATMNAIYAEVFGASPPARAAVQVARLPKDARVEIMVTAVRAGI